MNLVLVLIFWFKFQGTPLNLDSPKEGSVSPLSFGGREGGSAGGSSKVKVAVEIQARSVGSNTAVTLLKISAAPLIIRNI